MEYKEIVKLSRKLRRNQTEAEQILWQELRNRKLNGKKFLRQHPIIYENNKNEYFFFIPDFYCSEHKLAIELDGKIHDYRKKQDKNRDMILKEKGIKVLRIKNESVDNVEEVKAKILAVIFDSTLSP